MSVPIAIHVCFPFADNSATRQVISMLGHAVVKKVPNYLRGASMKSKRRVLVSRLDLSPETQKSACLPLEYHERIETCVGCKSTITLSPEFQKRLHETYKVYLWANPILCRLCKSNLNKLKKGVGIYRKKIESGSQVTAEESRQILADLNEIYILSGHKDIAFVNRVKKYASSRMA